MLRAQKRAREASVDKVLHAMARNSRAQRANTLRWGGSQPRKPRTPRAMAPPSQSTRRATAPPVRAPANNNNRMAAAAAIRSACRGGRPPLHPGIPTGTRAVRTPPVRTPPVHTPPVHTQGARRKCIVNASDAEVLDTLDVMGRDFIEPNGCALATMQPHAGALLGLAYAARHLPEMIVDPGTPPSAAHAALQKALEGSGKRIMMERWRGAALAKKASRALVARYSSDEADSVVAKDLLSAQFRAQWVVPIARVALKVLMLCDVQRRS